MIGFKCGVALYLASTQLPKLFGIKGGHGDFWERMGHFLTHLGETNPTSLALGAAALVLLCSARDSCPTARWRSSWWSPASPPRPSSIWRAAA